MLGASQRLARFDLEQRRVGRDRASESREPKRELENASTDAADAADAAHAAAAAADASEHDASSCSAASSSAHFLHLAKTPWSTPAWWVDDRPTATTTTTR